MDYEKKYNEALERASHIKDNNTVATPQEVAEHIFPELRESDDERIRKYLIDELKTAKSVGELKFTIPQPTREECIAYLEKQKESLHIQETYKENADSFASENERIRKEIIDFLETIPASELKRIPRPISEWFAWLEKQSEYHIPWYDYQKSKEAGYTIVPNEEYEQLIKQKEQNPIQSNIEKEYIRTIKSLISDFLRGKCDIDTGYYQKIYDWLDGRHIESNSAEWSEEDEDAIQQAIIALEDRYDEHEPNLRFLGYKLPFNKAAERLKSLHPSWKPSEEQVNCLCAAVDAAIRKHNESVSGYEPARVLKSLYEDLKKL